MGLFHILLEQQLEQIIEITPLPYLAEEQIVKQMILMFHKCNVLIHKEQQEVSISHRDNLKKDWQTC